MPDASPLSRQGSVDEQAIYLASNALCGWLLEHVDGATHQELCELHPDTWREIAEVALRAGRGEFDCRPFTMRPELRDA